MRPIRVLLAAIVVALLLSAPAQAAGGLDCRFVDARGVGEDRGGGVTEAKITRGGPLNGTTRAQFTPAGAPPVVTFTGDIVFTTNRGGTLTVSVAGTLNVPTGAFRAAGPVTSATGRLAGAVGFLVFDGVQTGTAFTETIRGVLCVLDD